jgi:hypothetical protein
LRGTFSCDRDVFRCEVRGLANGTSLTALDNVTLTTLTTTSSVIRIAAGKKITATTASLSTVTLLTSGWEIGSYDLIEASNLTAENITVSIR